MTRKRLLLLAALVAIALGCFQPNGVPTETHKLYLPLIQTQPQKFGVYLESVGEIPYLLTRGHNSSCIKWSVVEEIKGVYNWSAYDNFYNQLDGKGRRIIQVKNTPTWARPNGALDPVCIPPKSIYQDDFAAFIIAVIDRYQPYAVLIWNEPDAPPYIPEYIGCFPNGASYGNFVKAIYPIIKAARPNVIVGAGETAGSYTPFTSAFYANVEDNFDVATFHFYSAPTWNNLDILKSWIAYHRSKTDKPIWLTETSYRCNKYPLWCYDPFNKEQADYLRYLVTTDLGLESITWYHMKSDGWAQVGLVTKEGEKKPAWYVYRDYVGGSQ